MRSLQPLIQGFLTDCSCKQYVHMRTMLSQALLGFLLLWLMRSALAPQILPDTGQDAMARHEACGVWAGEEARHVIFLRFKVLLLADTGVEHSRGLSMHDESLLALQVIEGFGVVKAAEACGAPLT